MYWVPRASVTSGFQLVRSAEMDPAIRWPVALDVMVTEVRVPPVTVTLAPFATLAWVVPAFGEMVIFASEVCLAAFASSRAWAFFSAVAVAEGEGEGEGEGEEGEGEGEEEVGDVPLAVVGDEEVAAFPSAPPPLCPQAVSATVPPISTAIAVSVRRRVNRDLGLRGAGVGAFPFWGGVTHLSNDLGSPTGVRELRPYPWKQARPRLRPLMPELWALPRATPPAKSGRGRRVRAGQRLMAASPRH